MSNQGISTQAVVMSYNTTTGAYVVGDAANITLRLIKDGTVAAPANGIVEPSGAGLKGAYTLALTSAETQFNTVWIGGNSSSANTIIVPITLTFTSSTVGAVTVTGTPGVNVTQINGVSAASSSAQLGVNVITWRDGTPASLSGVLVQALASGVSVSAGTVTVGTNNDKTGYSLTSGEETAIANAVWDNASGIETNVTPRQALRYTAAASAGVTVGALTSTFTISAISAAGTTRLTASCDSSGNRTAVVLS